MCDLACEDCSSCPGDCFVVLCDDLVACTNDTCEAGLCVHTPNNAKCADDGDKCTDEVCIASSGCTHPMNALCGACCKAGVCTAGVTAGQCTAGGGTFTLGGVCATAVAGVGVTCPQIPTVTAWGMAALILVPLTGIAVHRVRKFRRARAA